MFVLGLFCSRLSAGTPRTSTTRLELKHDYTSTWVRVFSPFGFVWVCFGAPVGGILFSLEEASTFWSRSLTWQAFLGTMLAAVLAKLTKTGFSKLNTSGQGRRRRRREREDIMLFYDGDHYVILLL